MTTIAMIDRSRLDYKIFFTIASAIFALFLLGSTLSYFLVDSIIVTRIDENLYRTVNSIRKMVETSAQLSSRSYLRAISEHYAEMAADRRNLVQHGEISEQLAKSQVLAEMARTTIATSGYTYILNSQGTIISHPVADLQGANLSAQQFVAQQISQKEGFLEYQWQNPEDTAARDKILYMSYFAPWDWIFSVSAYRDELAQLVTVEDFRNQVLSLRIADHGYPFVVDIKGDILAHPLLQGKVAESGSEMQQLVAEFIATRQGKKAYSSTEPHTGIRRQMIVVFETIEEFGWVIAATGYEDDFYAPLKTLRRLFIALLAVGFFMAVLISWHLSRSVTTPLRRLLDKISGDRTSAQTVSTETAGRDEIEQISDIFTAHIEELNRSNEALRDLAEQERRTALDLSIYKEIFENIVEGITITDLQGNIIQANPAFEKITGYSVKEAIGKNTRILKSGQHPPEFYAQMWQQIQEQGFWSGKIWNRRKKGETYPEWLTISAVYNEAGEVTNYAGVFNDISELTEQQERVQYLAYHDYLTQLPNRLQINDRLAEVLSECRRTGEKLICLICDLDDFKTINDSLGQESADKLLCSFVERIRPLVRLEDVLGRIGGDEFVILAKTDTSAGGHAIAIADRLFSLTTSPFILEGKTIYLTLSVGITIFPDDVPEGEELLQRAILALNNAGKRKGNSVRFFSPEMEEQVNRKILYLARIREGLAHSEFVPYYQAKVNLTTGRVVGMEALARWQSGKSLVSPADFIPVAEDSGLIAQLSEQVYAKAFADTALLIAQGYALKLSVNLSPMQIQHTNFLETLLNLQRASGLAAANIELEITESILFENTSEVQTLLKTIASYGFSISVDDFGTGYSSLQYLKQLPLDALKIDMSFVSGIGTSQDDEHLVRIICLLAKQFGLHVVAEGVENEQQIDFLRALGCNDGQGYYFNRPMPYEQFREWLVQR